MLDQIAVGSATPRTLGSGGPLVLHEFTIDRARGAGTASGRSGAARNGVVAGLRCGTHFSLGATAQAWRELLDEMMVDGCASFT